MHSYTSHFIPRYLPQKNENESTRSYTWMYIAALLEMAQTWKQANYPSKDEWLKELWDSHTRYCSSAIKKRSNNMDEPQNGYIEWKKPDLFPHQKRLYAIAGTSDPGLVPGQLGTGPHIRRRAVVEQWKLHLLLPVTHITAWIIPPPHNWSLVPKMLETTVL